MEESTSTDAQPIFWSICYWMIALLNFGASFLCLFVFYSIMSNQKLRSNAFNLYVGFMIFPDSFYALSYAFLYVSKALTIPIFPTYEVAVYVYFVNFVVNFYANGVVTHEINKLIKQSNNRQRTQPPDLSRVYKQMAAVYSYGSFLGVWAILPVSWSLYHITDHAKGEGDLGSPPGGLLSRTAAIAIAYGTVLIPAGYVVYVSFRVWRHQLLPRKGKTRTLSLFFMRVIIVFVLFYFPNTATTVIQARLETASGVFWIRVVRGLLAAGQVYTTLYLIAHKDDIRQGIIGKYNCTLGKLCCKIDTTSNRGKKRSGSVRISGISLQQPSSRNIASLASLPRYSSDDDAELTSESRKSNIVQDEWEAEDEYDNNEDTTGKIMPDEISAGDSGGSDKDNNVAEKKETTTDEEQGQSRFKSVNMAGQLSRGSTSSSS